MAICDLADLPHSGRLIGIDPGRKTVGLALSDTSRLIASPLMTLERGRKLAPVLDKLFEQIDAFSSAGLIIGLPLNLDGGASGSTQAAKAFAGQILMKRDIPIAFQDERWTSAEVERTMLMADLSRKKRAARIDSAAAALILQTALDRMANQRL
ncbi:MAG: Holliday junction resolvase RuvX [Pseudomonadota bacterium]